MTGREKASFLHEPTQAIAGAPTTFQSCQGVGMGALSAREAVGLDQYFVHSNRERCDARQHVFAGLMKGLRKLKQPL